MKKRVLSVVLSLVLVIASISTAFAAQPSIDEADANVFYEGNKPFVLMERLLDELNADKEAEIFDESAHDFQYSYLRGVNSVIDSKDLEEAIGLLTEDLSDAQKMYLAACVKAESDDAFAAEFNAIDNVSDLSLKESFGKLDNYINDISVFLNAKGITVADYDADASKEIVAEPLVVLLNVIFAKDKDGMRDSYLEDFLKNDRAKKTLAVLFGSELTKEIVTDNFLSGGGTQGIVHHVKDYVAGLDGTALRDLKNQIENGILVTDSVESVDAAFDFIGSLVTAAYENDANASDSLKASVKMLMGDGTDAGLIELMVKNVDTNNNCDYYASSI